MPYGSSCCTEQKVWPGVTILAACCLWVALVAPLPALQQPSDERRAGQPAPVVQAPPVQQAAPASTIAKEVKVVSVLATVRDKHGEIIRDLGKDDFQIAEDGRPQVIRYFSRETDLPLKLGLLVDTSLSQRRVLGEECSASATFLDQVVRVDKDKAFVIHFDREVELDQDFTSSRQQLQAALTGLQQPHFAETASADPDHPQDSPQDGQQRRGGYGRSGGTLLYDAVYLASNEMMAKQQGRKAVLVLSDGVDRGSKETLASAIEAAQRADTVVYSILFSDRQDYGSQGWGRPGMGGRGGMGGMGRRGGGPGRYPQQALPDGKKILERLSKETGGQLFEVSKKEPLDGIYNRIQETLRNQYSLGYTPDSATSAAGYHKISLTTHRKGLVVQARDGYYAER